MAKQKEIDKENIHIFQLSSYVRPEIVEHIGREWVLNGKDNSFFHYVIDRYNGSPTNESIINVYCELIYGKGIALNGQDEIYEDLVEIFPKREQRKCIKDFKLFGQYDMQILRAKEGGGIAKILHLPTNMLGMDKIDEDGNINGVWFSADWTDVIKFPPKFYPAFTDKLTDDIMVKSVRPYQPGRIYFSDPDYLASLQAAELEEEISNFSINHIKSGLSFGYVINFNNGAALSLKQRDEIERKVKKRLTGSSNAGSVIISFNDGKDNETNIESVVVNSAHKQWEFWSGESQKKLLTAHGVTSPLLFGLPSASGFGANAEELNVASLLLQDYQINPKQDVFIDELASLLELAGLETDLVFIPLRETYKSQETVENENPTDKTVDEEESENVELSSHFELYDILDGFALDSPEGYDLTDGSEYDIKLSANQTSGQDSKLWKIRYKYVKGNKISKGNIAKGGHRQFCARMLFLAAKGKIFREEDIDLMSMQGVNGKFAHSGGKYNIFRFAGGVNCYHIWERRVFKKKLNPDGTPKKGAALASTFPVNVSEARRQGAKIPKNHPDVAIAEIDKPNKGRFSLKKLLKLK